KQDHQTGPDNAGDSAIWHYTAGSPIETPVLGVFFPYFSYS
ncbi:hypothetical protein LCGC14_3130470, partial [marine sediment metagenome]